MKKKQAWKVMGAVLAGALILSDAAPLRASAASETEKSAVQNQPSARTENDTEIESQQIAIYINLKKGSDTADGTSAEKAVKTVEKAQELLKEAVTELQEDPSAAEKNRNTDTGKTDAAAEKYLVFVGMDEKELENYKKKQQKTDFWGKVTDTVFAEDEIVVTEAGYEAALAAKKETLKTPTLTPGESPAPDPSAAPTVEPTTTPEATPTVEPSATPEAKPTVEPSATPEAKPTVEPSATPEAKPTVEPSATPEAKPSVEPSATPEAKPTVEPTVTPEAKPSVEPTVTPEATPTTVPDQKNDDSKNPENPETPAKDPNAENTKKDDANQNNPSKTENVTSSDQWKQDENLNDLVKDEVQKENETVKNYDEISGPSEVGSAGDGYLISDVSLLAQPMAVSFSGKAASEEQTETVTEVEKTVQEGEKELLAAAEQKSNLSAGEMVASAEKNISPRRITGTILVGPDNYGTNNTTHQTSSKNNSSSGSDTGSTKIPQKKTQTTASIRSIPVNTGDETMVLPLAISSALSAAVMFCMAFLQMQAKRAKSMAAWLEFKKNHPFDEE
ncbi:hypothetical protein [Fusicatenibacter sp.]